MAGGGDAGHPYLELTNKSTGENPQFSWTSHDMNAVSPKRELDPWAACTHDNCVTLTRRKFMSWSYRTLFLGSAKSSSGLLEMSKVQSAAEAVVLVNHVTINPEGNSLYIEQWISK